MPRLKLLKGRAAWKDCSFDTSSILIGRDKRSCDVILSDDTVSRRHAEIVGQGSKHFVVDRESRAGTSLNNQRLEQNKPYALESGDLIQICHYVLAYHEDSTDSDSGNSSVQLEEDESSGYSSILESTSGSWASRTSINPEAKLTAIIGLIEDLRGCGSLEELLSSVLDSLLRIFRPTYRGVVVLTESNYRPSVTRFVRHRSREDSDTAVISAGLIAGVLTNQVAMISQEECMMCVPLLDAHGQPLGVIQLDAHGSGRFSKDDLDLLTTVAVEVSFAIENFILHEIAICERQMRFELNVANEVQIGLLPSAPPVIEGYDFYDYYSPAMQVGGDHYDYLTLDDNKLAFVLGDVSGKGVPAALLMAKVSSEMSVYLASGLGPREVIKRVNPRFEKQTPTGTFVTIIVALLDLVTHEIVLVNAGHMLPLLRQIDANVAEIGGGQPGLPLGIYPVQHYEEVRFTLRRGETLLLYSDGVTDATCAAQTWYGEERLRAKLAECAGTATDVGACIMSDVHDFVGNHPQTDDICLMCVHREK